MNSAFSKSGAKVARIAQRTFYIFVVGGCLEKENHFAAWALSAVAALHPAPSGVDVPLAEIARREDLLKLMSAVAANPKLARSLFLLATAEDELLETISSIISRVQEIKEQGGEAAPLLDTATAALCHPVENLRLMRLLKGNGFRARALRWILRFER